jgi:hypothetical protein
MAHASKTFTGIAASDRHVVHRHALSQDFRVLRVLFGTPIFLVLDCIVGIDAHSARIG